MIYLIGGFNTQRAYDQLLFLNDFNLTKDDFVIVLGNLGYQYTDIQDACAKAPYTILSLEGLFDNTNELYSMNMIDFYGGKAHKLSDNVYHLVRGSVFSFDDKKIFVMGGDQTYNNERLYKDVDYYGKEAPDDNELSYALECLENNSWKVNYVLTTIPDSKTLLCYDNDCYPTDLSNWLFETGNNLNYERWYFGKYADSLDKDYNRVTAIGEGVIPLGLSVADIRNIK